MLESSKPPLIIPIYAHGFEKVIPEDRPPGFRLWKQAGQCVQIGIANIVEPEEWAGFRTRWQELVAEEVRAAAAAAAAAATTVATAAVATGEKQLLDLNERLRTGEKAHKLRSEVASWVRDRLEKLRTQEMGLSPETLPFGDPEFWNPKTGGCRDVPVMGIVNKLDIHK